MDLSHMVGLWLAGQGPSVMPGGVGVVYAPEGVGDDESIAGRQGGVGRYPFSTQALSLRDPSGWVSAAGLALIGELEYGPDGLDGFVPRLWSAAGVAMGDVGCGMVDGGTGATIGALLNRGAGSIGLSDRLRFVDRFDREGVLGRARVAGWVQRGGELWRASDDAAVADFPVMFGTLSDYLRFQVSAQVEGNGYDDLAGALARCGRPTHAVVLAGFAGPCTQVPGAPTELAVGDVCHSVVYDSAMVSLDEIERSLRSGDTRALDGEAVSWLRREVAG